MDERVSAFTTKSDSIRDRLINIIDIVYGQKSMKATALWDTGANVCCISKSVAEALEMVSTGRKRIQTPSGTSIYKTYLVDLILPNHVEIKDVEVCESEIGDQGLGLLVGMNIITMGDFSVTNHNGKTVFSFRVPSMQRVDYTKQLSVANVMRPSHGTGKKKRKR